MKKAISLTVLASVLSAGVAYAAPATPKDAAIHFADSGVNVVTTEYSDWATNCPEYKVTAVQVRRVNHLSEWQERDRAAHAEQWRLAGRVPADAAE